MYCAIFSVSTQHEHLSFNTDQYKDSHIVSNRHYWCAIFVYFIVNRSFMYIVFYVNSAHWTRGNNFVPLCNPCKAHMINKVYFDFKFHSVVGTILSWMKEGMNNKNHEKKVSFSLKRCSKIWGNSEFWYCGWPCAHLLLQNILDKLIHTIVWLTHYFAFFLWCWIIVMHPITQQLGVEVYMCLRTSIIIKDSHRFSVVLINLLSLLWLAADGSPVHNLLPPSPPSALAVAFVGFFLLIISGAGRYQQSCFQFWFY